jgi:hypothetical protein
MMVGGSYEVAIVKATTLTTCHPEPRTLSGCGTSQSQFAVRYDCVIELGCGILRYAQNDKGARSFAT